MEAATDLPNRKPSPAVRVFTIPSMRPPPEPPRAADRVNSVFVAVVCLWIAAMITLSPVPFVKASLTIWFFPAGLGAILLSWAMVAMAAPKRVDVFRIRTERRAARIARLRRIFESRAARARLPHRLFESDLLAIPSVDTELWKDAAARLPWGTVVLIGRRPTDWYGADRSPVYSEPIDLAKDSGTLWELARQRRLVTFRAPPWDADLPPDATPEQSEAAMREWMRRNTPARTWPQWFLETMMVIGFVLIALGCLGGGAAAIAGCLWYTANEAIGGRPMLLLVVLGIVGVYLLPNMGGRNRVVVFPGGIATVSEWPWSSAGEVKLYTPERSALALDSNGGAILASSGGRVDSFRGGSYVAVILLWCSTQARPSVAAISQYFGGAPVRAVG